MLGTLNSVTLGLYTSLSIEAMHRILHFSQASCFLIGGKKYGYRETES